MQARPTAHGHNQTSASGRSGTRSAFPQWESLLSSTGTPPPPLILQNLGNKGVILPLCARSLSLKELHAKSREHGGCADAKGVLRPILAPQLLRRSGSYALARVKLSKIAYYRIDNNCNKYYLIVKRAVNSKKARLRSEHFGHQSGRTWLDPWPSSSSS